MKRLLLLVFLVSGLYVAQAQNVPRKDLAISYFDLLISTSFTSPERQCMVDSAYLQVDRILRSYGCLDMLPKDELKNKVQFDQWGYPMCTSFKKAFQANPGHNLVKIIVKLMEGGSTAIMSSGTTNYVDITKMHIELKVIVNIEIADAATGKSVFSQKGEAFTQGKVFVNGENLFLKETVRQVALQNPVSELLSDALSQICDKLY